SGSPDAILSTLACGWKSSPSANSHCRTVLISRATVVLPAAETPITTRCSGVGSLAAGSVIRHTLPRPGQLPPGLPLGSLPNGFARLSRAATTSRSTMATVNPDPDFDVVLLGTDFGIYGLARAFHERYGIVSTVISR